MRNPFRLKNTIEHEDWAVPEQEVGIDFEESIMDSGSAGTLERGSDQNYGRGTYAVSAILFILLFGRLYDLAIVKHDYFRAAAEGNRLRVEYVPAPRGAIYDSRGAVLAGNKPSFEAVAIPLDLPIGPERNEIVARAAGILEMQPQDILEIINNEQVRVFQSVLIKQNVARESALIFHERAAELPGFRMVNTPIRDYHGETLAYSHLIGYVGKLNAEEHQDKQDEGYLFNDSIGKTGLEAQYESTLRGKFAERQVEVDARGIVRKIFGETATFPGQNLVLNIDAELQKTIYESLSRQLRALNRRKAVALAMDPKTGAVLAYVSLPGFDNNKFAEGISAADYKKLAADRDQPLFNRGIGGIYPPGSTVKPMVAAAALQEGVITAETILRDEGQIVIKNPFGGPDSVFIGYGRKALGLMNVRRAIALSSDISFYIMGGGFGPAKIDGLGIERVARYYRMFKIGDRLGIDLPGEKPGLVPDPEWKQSYFTTAASQRWYLGDTYHVSIGQGDLLASPLHVLSWTATIANNGRIMKPGIVNRVVDGEEKLVEEFKPEVIGQVAVSQENLKVVQEGMRQAVLSGTGTSLQRLSISSAAKTGTAQFDAKNPNRAHAWFTAYAPFEDPQIAITVLIEDGGEGGINSVPVVRDALDWWSKNRYQR